MDGRACEHRLKTRQRAEWELLGSSELALPGSGASLPEPANCQLKHVRALVVLHSPYRSVAANRSDVASNSLEKCPGRASVHHRSRIATTPEQVSAGRRHVTSGRPSVGPTLELGVDPATDMGDLRRACRHRVAYWLLDVSRVTTVSGVGRRAESSGGGRAGEEDLWSYQSQLVRGSIRGIRRMRKDHRAGSSDVHRRK
jgi:hypothetical protein